MTNFATCIDTHRRQGPGRAAGKAKQKRTDLRLVGLGMVVTRAGGSRWSGTPPRRDPGPREDPPHPRTAHHRNRHDHPPPVHAVIDCEMTGESPADRQLTCTSCA